MSIPPISGNLLLVPAEFADLLLQERLGRNELLVAIFLARRAYSIPKDSAILSAQAIGERTRLNEDAVQPALSRLVDRGLVLRLELEGGESFLYALATEEHRCLAGVADSSPQEPRVDKPRSEETATIARPIAATPPPTALERITKMLGRELTKDEAARLDVLEAPESDLHAAIDGISSRKIRVYSSDQFIYEYESMKLAERRKEEEERIEAEKRKPRTCPKCNGVGYLFIGKASLRPCDCKR